MVYLDIATLWIRLFNHFFQVEIDDQLDSNRGGERLAGDDVQIEQLAPGYRITILDVSMGRASL